jgi:hypothetical protein
LPNLDQGLPQVSGGPASTAASSTSRDLDEASRRADHIYSAAPREIARARKPILLLPGLHETDSDDEAIPSFFGADGASSSQTAIQLTAIQQTGAIQQTPVEQTPATNHPFHNDGQDIMRKALYDQEIFWKSLSRENALIFATMCADSVAQIKERFLKEHLNVSRTLPQPEHNALQKRKGRAKDGVKGRALTARELAEKAVSREINRQQNASQGRFVTVVPHHRDSQASGAGGRERRHVAGAASAVTMRGRRITARKPGFYLRLNKGQLESQEKNLGMACRFLYLPNYEGI